MTLNITTKIVDEKFIGTYLTENYELEAKNQNTYLLKPGRTYVYAYGTNQSTHSIFKLFPNSINISKSVNSEVELLEILSKDSIAAKVFKNTKGSNISELNVDNSDWIGFLQEYLPGENKSFDLSGDPGRYGESLGIFHRLLRKHSSKSLPKQYISNSMWLENFCQLLNTHSRFSNATVKELSNITSDLANYISRVNLAELSAGIIHGDLHVENFIKTKDKVKIIDLEFAGEDNLIYDLATFKIGRAHV